MQEIHLSLLLPAIFTSSITTEIQLRIVVHTKHDNTINTVENTFLINPYIYIILFFFIKYL